MRISSNAGFRIITLRVRRECADSPRTHKRGPLRDRHYSTEISATWLQSFERWHVASECSGRLFNHFGIHSRGLVYDNVSAPARPNRRLDSRCACPFLLDHQAPQRSHYVRGIVFEIETELATPGFSASWSFRQFGGESSFRRNAWGSLWTGGLGLTHYGTWRVNQRQ